MVPNITYTVSFIVRTIRNVPANTADEAEKKALVLYKAEKPSEDVEQYAILARKEHYCRKCEVIYTQDEIDPCDIPF